MAKKVKRKRPFVQLHEKLNGWALPVMTLGGKEYTTPNGMPSSVVVKGQKFEIIYHSNIYESDPKHRRLRGIMIPGFRTIVLDARQTIHALRETLYHEMAHVYLNEWRDGKSVLAKLTPTQVEELCDLFADSYYDSLTNNPSA